MANSPDLMFEEALTPVKGWFHEAALDCEGKLSSNVEFDVPPGRVVHIVDTEVIGRKLTPIFEMGVSNTGMAIFLLNGSTSYDVSNPGTTRKGNFMHKAIAPSDVLSGLVATGGYELSTTEFDTDQTYTPGDLLTAPAVNNNATTGGRLTNRDGGSPLDVPWESDLPVCGVVSRGKYKNEHKVWVLQFYPVYLPAALA